MQGEKKDSGARGCRSIAQRRENFAAGEPGTPCIGAARKFYRDGGRELREHGELDVLQRVVLVVHVVHRVVLVVHVVLVEWYFGYFGYFGYEWYFGGGTRGTCGTRGTFFAVFPRIIYFRART